MEGNIVFGHELVEVHLGEDIGRLPETLLKGVSPEYLIPLTSHLVPTDRLTESSLLVLDSSTISPIGLCSWL